MTDRFLQHWIADLKNPSSDVRCEAVCKIGDSAMPSPDVQEALVSAFADPVADVRLHAARSLWKLFGDPALFVEPLLGLLTCEDIGVRSQSWHLVDETGLSTAVSDSQLLQGLRDPYWEVRSAALFMVAFGHPVSPAGIELIRSILLHDPDPVLRKEAIETLDKLPRETSGPLESLLQTALCDPDEYVRLQAAIAMRNLHPQHVEATAILHSLRDHEDHLIRLQVARAYWKQDQNAKAALPILASLLEDSFFEGYLLTLSLITEMGAAAYPLGPKVALFLHYPIESLGQAAAACLKAINR